MRSVQKGDHPVQENGERFVFRPYINAAPHLKERLGRYCSFCERFVPTALAVEHKLPKLHYGHLEFEWTNFLLACPNCNSTKLTHEVTGVESMFPDTHDTFRAIEYLRSGRIQARDTLAANDLAAAKALLHLVGLSKEPRELSVADDRWKDRMELWRLAEDSLRCLRKMDTPEMRELIVGYAKGKGGFSIWMAVFAEEPAMQAAFVEAFPGTHLHRLAA
ncbi:HNH endonuclease [Roseateles sp. L2-2]|uniref:HNH endonuclease n=1 Tax=Roseateles sp. L2-2 TaxID=3422597 RepID=UPI003D35AA8A